MLDAQIAREMAADSKSIRDEERRAARIGRLEDRLERQRGADVVGGGSSDDDDNDYD